MAQSKVQVNTCGITDHQIKMIVEMAIKFYADPDNDTEYREWHKKKYGCYPNEDVVKAV